MDSRKRQTSTVTPAQPGDFPLWFKKFYLSKHVHMHKHHKEDMAKLPCAITRAMMPAGERVSLLALAGKVCQAMRHHSMRCA